MRRPVIAWLACAAFVLLLAQAAVADQPAALGRMITDVGVEIAGRSVSDANVLGLIETRIGETLAMQDVRSTIEHLVGLGRFEDVRVFTTTTGQGVSLRWQLTPVRRIADISVSGNAVLSGSTIRAEVVDRFGALPSANRVADIVTALQAYYADRGFPRAIILPRIEEDDPAPERVALVLSIEAGARIAVAAARVTGSPLQTPDGVIDELQLRPGQPFDRPAIDARVAAYEEALRQRGHYEAQVRVTDATSADGRSASITVDVRPGPRVRLVFAGEAVSDDLEDLVPIRSERSVDQDLLEDASRAIEDALREQGYRAAQAPYARSEQGGELVLTFTIARGPLHRIGSIETAGNTALDRAAIAPLLQVQPGEPFVEARTSAVAAAITELYRVRGFAQAAVTTNVQVLPETSDNGVSYRPVAVRFEIVEGPQTMVSGVAVQGSQALGAEQVRSALGLAAGRPFYRPQLAVDRDTIERLYRNRGYQDVSVISQLAFAGEQRAVAVTWMVREGEQLTIDRVLISGNARVATALIERELTIQPGDPLSEEAMIDSQRRLAELGLFRRVRITELPRTGSLTRDVLVDLEEADTTTIDYGGGFEVSGIGERADDGSAVDALDFGPRGFIGISRRNLWGKNRSVTLFGRVTLRRDSPDDADPAAPRGYGFHDYRGLFTFREPRAFGTTGDAQFTAFVEQARRTSFDFNRKGLTSDYARRIGPFTVTGRYTFDYTKVFARRISVEDQLLIDRLFPQVRLSKVFGGILRDSRDDVLDPQRGAVIGVDTSVAAKSLGSEVGFVKSFFQGFVYRRLPGRGVVVAAGARMGLAAGFAQAVPPVQEIAAPPAKLTRSIVRAERAEPFPSLIREVPASERFFAGGDTTVRGFALDRLGSADTLDENGFPTGGNGMLIFNLETRAPYWKDLQFVWFLDAGNVYRLATDIRLDDMRVSSGVGLRYRSPIGPLRVDWGWKLGTQLLSTGGRERSNVLHISLGQAF